MTASGRSSANSPRYCRGRPSKFPRAGISCRNCAINFRRGTDVTITFLPGDNYRHNVETATALRRAGFNPVPHIAAREMASREMLDDFLARARGEADVTRVLLIAGDVARAKGPFKSSLDVCASGSIEAHGIKPVSVAGHPEGHPFLEAADAFTVLGALAGLGTRDRHPCRCGDAILLRERADSRMDRRLDRRGIDLPVIVGLAGPATPATLTKFALRCGIGNSMRALRGQIGRFGRLLTDTGPDDVMRGLRAAPAGRRRRSPDSTVSVRRIAQGGRLAARLRRQRAPAKPRG